MCLLQKGKLVQCSFNNKLCLSKQYDTSAEIANIAFIEFNNLVIVKVEKEVEEEVETEVDTEVDEEVRIVYFYSFQYLIFIILENIMFV